MEESKKEANKASPKAKKSLIDEEFGNDFLSSWKSMTATEDDAMDFSFDKSEKGMQKKFNFDKLDMDMDFNLSGDFGKLSSFKLDMPDLDFSSAPKKTAKLKEGNAEESSGGNRRGMGERFSFSFDFNEVDSFDFESSLTKGEKAPKKDLTAEKVASENIGDQSSGFHQSEDENKLIHASKSTDLPSIDNSVTSDGDLASTRKNSVGESTNSELALQQNEETLYVTKSIPEEEHHQQAHLSEENLSSIPYAEHREGENSESDSHLHLDAFSMGTTGDGTPQIGENICDTMTKEEISFHGNSQSPDPPSLDMYISETVSTDKMLDVSASEYPMDSIKCLHGEPNHGNEPTQQRITGEKQFNGTMKEDGEKVALALLSRERTSEVTSVNVKESGVLHSNFFKRVDDNGSRTQLLPSIVMKPMQIEANRVVSVNRSSTEEIRERSTTNDIGHGGMVISNLNTTSGDRTAAAELLKSEIASKSSKNGGELRDKKLVERQKIIDDTSKIGSPSPEPPPNTIAILRNQTRAPQLVERNQVINDASNIGDQTKGEKLVQSLKVNEDASIVGDQTRVPKLIDRPNINEHASKAGGQPRAPRLVQSEIIQNSSKSSDQTRVPTLASQKIIDCASKVGLQLRSSTLVKKLNASADQVENPQPMTLSIETLGNSTISSLGANKLNPTKASKTTSNLPALSISRKEEQLCPRQLPGSSNTSSSQKSAELRTNSLEKIPPHSHGNDVDKQTLLTSKNSMHKQVFLSPPLKRKIHESADTNLISPFKRLSPSPGESSFRRSNDSSEKVVSEERRQLLAYSHPNRVNVKPKNVSNSNLASSQVEISNEMKKMAQLEISSVMENDGTVEKAEAFTKELEDMRNMLKKKQEEAKDLLLRAIVNNNKLLMLNHPMFAHKMRKVQKLASQLTGKEVRMCID